MPKDRDAPASSEDAAPVRFDSPRSIRALAHPARLAIINALATGEELTATQCAELTGLSPSATAYHLNLLERYGFAEPAPQRADRRERPWRTTGRRLQVDLDSSTPAGASAASAVVAAYFDTTRALGIEFTAGEYAEPEEWRSAVLSNVDLWLTAKEVEKLSQQLAALIKPHRRTLRGERPPGSRRVRVMNVIVPHPRTDTRQP